MQSDLEALGRAVRAHRAGGGGFRLPPTLRSQITTAACQARAAGKPMNAIASVVGVSSQSIMRWTGTETARMVPVRLAAQPMSSPTLTLISPSGWKIFGLEVSEAAALLRALS